MDRKRAITVRNFYYKICYNYFLYILMYIQDRTYIQSVTFRFI